MQPSTVLGWGGTALIPQHHIPAALPLWDWKGTASSNGAPSPSGSATPTGTAAPTQRGSVGAPRSPGAAAKHRGAAAHLLSRHAAPRSPLPHLSTRSRCNPMREGRSSRRARPQGLGIVEAEDRQSGHRWAQDALRAATSRDVLTARGAA